MRVFNKTSCMVKPADHTWFGKLALSELARPNRFQVLEAYADANLANLDSLLPSPVYYQLIPSIDYQNTPVEEIPLLVLQITRFVFGGFSLGLSISHAVADGQSALHFVSEWARVSRGELVGIPPYLDRKVLRAGDPPRTLKMVNHEQFGPPPGWRKRARE
ncbi:putative transferase [Helianthus anomalus]